MIVWLALIAGGAFLLGLMSTVFLEIQTGWIYRQFRKRHPR
jgi:hypothetical protein